MQIYSIQAQLPKMVELGFQDGHMFNALLPEADVDLIQTGRGSMNGHARILRIAQARVIRMQLDTSAIVRSSFDKHLIVFMLPLVQKYRVYCNGFELTTGSLMRLTGTDGLVTRGSGRDVMTIGLPRRWFHEALAALQGVEPDDVDLSTTRLSLPAPMLDRIRLAIRHERNKPVGAGDEIASELTSALLEANLCAAPGARGYDRHMRNPIRLVRLAEDRFVASSDRRVSLADLCAAAGVSAATLYRAFQEVCNMSPLSYFRTRRLNQAHGALLGAQCNRGAIKRAAIDAGFTELGRFSAEYRRLFAESPSATLARSRRVDDCPL